jgi:hypothetical protein
MPDNKTPKEKKCEHNVTGHMWEEYCSKCGMKYGHSPTAEEDAKMLQGDSTPKWEEDIKTATEVWISEKAERLSVLTDLQVLIRGLLNQSIKETEERKDKEYMDFAERTNKLLNEQDKIINQSIQEERERIKDWALDNMYVGIQGKDDMVRLKDLIKIL